MTQGPLELLLAYDDGPADALPYAAADPGRRTQDLPDRLRADNDDIDDLARQRYCVVVPAGDRGRRLRALVEPLVARRAAEQRAPVPVVPVPPRMSLEAAHQWYARYAAGFADPLDLPRYFLLLGDLDEVPLAVQQAIALADGCPGRLCFDRDDDLAAYAARAAAHDDAAPPSVLLHAAATDPTTERARARLLVPILARLRERHDLGELPATAVVERPALAAPDPHAILLSISHGYGGERGRGFTDEARRRREQGALVLPGGALLRGEDLTGAPFLPHGFWFMFACYSAGTPDASVYAPWLQDLQGGAFAAIADQVARALPPPGARPFVAALPRAALASPNGPLACFGHVDVAWQYSYEDRNRASESRPGKFTRLLEDACRGHRAGALARGFARAATDAALGLASSGPAPSDALRHLWLLHHDLAGYILLGDPAVRLTARPDQQHASAAPPTAPPAPAPPAVDPALAELARRLGAGRLEEALAHARVTEPARKVATRLGITVEELRALEAAYRAAGRRALGLPDP